ncbi:MAG: hypothetical protein K0S44_1875 [Bacteroidetes bacterium]|jgi:hypothetical protein|nr:hypothetical protein [Bacteroidota bacterium]
MSKKSKLDLVSLQKQFDQILGSLTNEEVLAWIEQDKEEQCALMLSGSKISVIGKSVSYTISNEYKQTNQSTYEHNQAA